MAAKRTHRPAAAKAGILIVDDHPVIRQGLRALLKPEPDLAVCAEASGIAEALDVLDKTDPRLAIVDLGLKADNGLDLIPEIRRRRPDLPVLVLSQRDETVYAEQALRAGARGYVTKSDGPDRILQAVRLLLRGEIALSERMSEQLLRKFACAKDAGGGPAERLSRRELEIFTLMGQGLPTREIAGRLGISTRTIESHREHIKQKLQISDAAELVKHAVHWLGNKESGA